MAENFVGRPASWKNVKKLYTKDVVCPKMLVEGETVAAEAEKSLRRLASACRAGPASRVASEPPALASSPAQQA